MTLHISSLSHNNVFSVTCQACQWTHRFDPAIVDQHGRIVKIFGMKGYYIFNCRCGGRYNIKLDFRKESRHPIEASAFYTTLTKHNSENRLKSTELAPYQTHINCILKNISVDGIGFVSNGHHDIKPGDELVVKFTLKRSGGLQPVLKRIIARSVSDNFIGAEFFPKDKKDPRIGFFLMESNDTDDDDDDLFYEDEPFY